MTGLGPAEDHSRFVSAKLAGDGKVVFTAQRLVYRPAAGWRAFPDGGIPRYSVDRNVVGILDLSDKSFKIIREIKNTDWQHGQGTFFVSHANSGVAVVSESGQRKKDYESDVRHYMLGMETGSLGRVSIKDGLARRGRQTGYFYILDRAGTLLFVNQPLKSYGKNTFFQDIWLRYPSGEYLKVASGADYYGFQGREVVYWSLDERRLHAFNADTRADVYLDRYDPESLEEARLDARISVPDGKRLELWEKVGDAWRLKEVLLQIERIR